MARRIVGKYWKYTGNSVSKWRNHERRTPRGYSFDDVMKVAAIARDVTGETCFGYDAQVSKAEAAQIEIIDHSHRGDNFGHEVTVKAPKSVWEKVSTLEF